MKKLKKLHGRIALSLLTLTLLACQPVYRTPCDVSGIPEPLDPVIHCKSDECVRQQCALFCRHYPDECEAVCGVSK